MICPSCRKPYYFLQEEKKDFLQCRRCGYAGDFSPPSYDGYHEALYEARSCSRTTQTDPQLKKICRTLDIGPGQRLVDLGCGTGESTQAFAILGTEVTGLDRDTRIAERKFPKLHFLQGDCNAKLPFSDDVFDRVVSINTIEHLADSSLFLAECRRILKPGGKIALTTANYDFFLHDFFFDRTHLHEWTLKEFRKVVTPYFQIDVAEKSSGMFKCYPANLLLTAVLKPDLLLVGTKI